MDFDTSVFWPAMKQAGMLTAVSYQPLVGPVILFDAGFKQSDEIVLDGMVSATNYSLEYQSADITLKRGDVVIIGGKSYRLRQTPQQAGIGAFIRAELELLP